MSDFNDATLGLATEHPQRGTQRRRSSFNNNGTIAILGGRDDLNGAPGDHERSVCDWLRHHHSAIVNDTSAPSLQQWVSP